MEKLNECKLDESELDESELDNKVDEIEVARNNELQHYLNIWKEMVLIMIKYFL